MARQYGGWVRATDTSTATTTKTVQLAADVPAGAAVVVGIYNRSNATATLSSISDPVNGTWSSHQVQGPTDCLTTRGWLAVLPNSAALVGGTDRTITVTTSAGISSVLVAGWVDDDTVTLEFDAFATALVQTTTATNWDSNTINVTRAGVIVGMLCLVDSQGATAPTMDGAGETLRTTVADAGVFRNNLMTQDVASAGTHGFETTVTSTARGIYTLFSLVEPAGGDPAPTLTSVNGGTSVTMDGTAQPVVGADFDSVTFELEQDDGPIALDSANEDADSADIDVVSTVTPSPKFGNATLRAINADDQQDELAVTVDPPTGTDWVEIATVNTEDIILEYTPALATGDQLWWRVTDNDYDETDVTINDDGTFNLTVGLLPEFVEVNRRRADTGAWEGWEEIPIDDGVPDLVEVPDVVGDDEATATTALEGAGFVVTVSSDYSASVAVGDVISQSPPGGSTAEEGSAVAIVISLGAAEGAGGGLILMRRRGRR